MPLLAPDLLEDVEQAVPSVSLASPLIFPASYEFYDTAVDFNVYRLVHEHANEFLLAEAANLMVSN